MKLEVEKMSCNFVVTLLMILFFTLYLISWVS